MPASGPVGQFQFQYAALVSWGGVGRGLQLCGMGGDALLAINAHHIAANMVGMVVLMLILIAVI